VARAVHGATVCTAIGAAIEPISVFGEIGAGGTRLVPNPGSVEIEYLRPGARSWWSMVPSIVRHMGVGKAPSGAWSALLLAVFMATAVVLVSWLILCGIGGGDRRRTTSARTLRRVLLRCPDRAIARMLRGVPTEAWICALVACLSAASWSLVTPPFQVTDEPSHFAYVQQLAETGQLPKPVESPLSPIEEIAVRDLHFFEVRWHPERHTIFSPAQQRRLQEDLRLPLARYDATDNAGVASTQPPLFYALEAIPYSLGSGGTLLDQLELMRLLSALLAGVTVLFIYLFLREALPRLSWAWTAGCLSAALAPLLGSMSGAVNPDAMLCAVSAVIFYLLARGFRRGLTPRLALAIGATTAIGFLTKLNFVGLAPGVLLGLIVLAVRARHRIGERSAMRLDRRHIGAYRQLALALAVAFIPVAVYATVNILSRRPILGLLSSTVSEPNRHAPLLDELVYIWQLYLPRLPGMTNDFPGVFAIRELWFDRGVGLYGWLDTSFPSWVDNLALIVATPIGLLGLLSLWTSRRALRPRLIEIGVYAVIGAGLMALVGTDSYTHLRITGGGYAEPRYLLPLLPLLAAALALSARGAGRRWGPVAGTLIVLLFLAHDLFSQLLTISRFYG
jgi:hypothetical protein